MIILWLALAFAVGYYASTKGRSGVGFFFLSCFLSPLVGGIFALVVKPNIKISESKLLRNKEYKKCHFCSEIIKQEAIVCRYCHKELQLK
ncbi:hypothetical protein LEWO105114_12230 [Legionella worsleiensis]|uniref:hypothetical protein n=1 Tax=Legionella pneumophila TaxID=446 RepID=UPI0007708BBC|nr:hypothetical protein [Legionella pneumophila]CZP48056.1 Uncharacterised protein [Legionella pneumophila]CZP68586.1 Uncharacterised protein [Legionella pneumophila]CZP75469.1 Uncharacterised protein [Legionella pneumophila]STY50000.1 Uncharacterised protein [Legionella worsleiensis]